MSQAARPLMHHAAIRLDSPAAAAGPSSAHRRLRVSGPPPEPHFTLSFGKFREELLASGREDGSLIVHRRASFGSRLFQLCYSRLWFVSSGTRLRFNPFFGWPFSWFNLFFQFTVFLFFLFFGLLTFRFTIFSVYYFHGLSFFRFTIFSVSYFPVYYFFGLPFSWFTFLWFIIFSVYHILGLAFTQ